MCKQIGGGRGRNYVNRRARDSAVSVVSKVDFGSKQQQQTSVLRKMKPGMARRASSAARCCFARARPSRCWAARPRRVAATTASARHRGRCGVAAASLRATAARRTSVRSAVYSNGADGVCSVRYARRMWALILDWGQCVFLVCFSCWNPNEWSSFSHQRPLASSFGPFWRPHQQKNSQTLPTIAPSNISNLFRLSGFEIQRMTYRSLSKFLDEETKKKHGILILNSFYVDTLTFIV